MKWVSFLSNFKIHLKEKLNKFKPETIGDASQISGVSHSVIGILLIYLKKNQLLEKNEVKLEKNSI